METRLAPRGRPVIGELRVSSGGDAGRVVAVVDNMVLGRDSGADVVLHDPSGKLSRRHARIRLSDGMPVLEDLDSTNGTFLNGKRIQAPQPLKAGDRIAIGESTLEFVPSPDLDPATMQVTSARKLKQVTFAPPGTDGELRIVSGPGAGTTAPVRAGSATIGREPECDMQVLDSEVSRRHAKVTIRDGVATIDDLHSGNGTYVNGERILGSYRLAPGDVIDIGEATIELTSPVFEGTAVRPQPIHVTAIRDVLARSQELLSAPTGNRKWWTLGVVVTTTFMLLLDVTIVSVALPSISKALHPTFSELQWVVDAYTLALTTVLLAAGSMADIFGRKRVLTIGLIVFTLASLLCGLSTTTIELILSRGLQGVGGATMFACALALIVQEFPAHERAIAFGAYGAVNGVSIAVGPIVGGLLVEGFGWEAIFFLNIPIGIAAFVVLQRKVVNLPGPETKIDWPGVATFSAFMFLTVFGTIRGNAEGWTSAQILGCYAGAIAFLAAFIRIELRRAFPMFELRLFRNRTFVGSSVSAFTICFSCLGLIFFLTVWFQSILGYSAIGTGTRMLVFTGVALAVAPIAGKATETVSPRLMLGLSLGLVSVGVLTMTRVDANDSWTVILPGLVLAGAGLGLAGPTLASTAVGVVPSWRGGMASGMNSTMREAGTTAGIAVLGVVLQHQVTNHVQSALSGSVLANAAKPIANAITAGGTTELLAQQRPALRPELEHVARVSYAAGLQDVFLLAAVVAAVGCVVAVALVRKSDVREDAVAGH